MHSLQRRREAHSTLDIYDYEAKNIRTYTPSSSPGTRLLLTGNFLHIIAVVPVLFSVFFGALSRTYATYFREKVLYVKYELYDAYYITVSL